MGSSIVQPPSDPDPVLPRVIPRLRPRPSFPRRLARSIQARIREAFSREQIISSLKSMAWVAPMTVLIWIYAEREQITKERAHFFVEIRNSDPNRVVELSADAEGHSRTNIEVSADLAGPQARFQDIKEKLDAGLALQIEVPEFEPGRHSLSLSRLENDPLFVNSGLSVSDIAPADVTVMIDPIEHVDLEVKARPTVTNLEGQPVFEPAAVHVSGPRSVLEAARQQGRLTAYAELGPLNDPGVKILPNVKVSVLSDPHVSATPGVVSAKVTVKRSDQEGVVRAVPVFVLYPPTALWDKYKVDYEKDRTLDDVHVVGPPEMIQQINDPAFEPKPKAIFDVNAASPPVGGSNPAGSQHEARLWFDFGNTGLKISPDDAHKTITFTVVERKGSD